MSPESLPHATDWHEHDPRKPAMMLEPDAALMCIETNTPESGADEPDTIDIDVQATLVDSFDEFYRREFRPVVGLAFALCGSTGMAEDIAQEAFVAAFGKWNRIKNPSGWVRRVVANKSVSTFRRKTSEAKALVGLREQTVTDPALPEPTTDLWDQVRRLPQRQMQVLALRYVDGMSISQIAEVLNISENTVKTHLQRAKAALAEQQKDQR